LGTDSRLNAVFGSNSKDAAEREINFLFGKDSKAVEIPISEHELTNATMGPQKTLAILKPHIVESGKVDEIIEKILCRGFKVTNRDEPTISTELAQELLVDYKDDPTFATRVASITGGPCVALVLKGEGVVKGWKEMIGPSDPEVARAKWPAR
jgi:nucleoside diphosphate kinase